MYVCMYVGPMIGTRLSPRRDPQGDADAGASRLGTVAANGELNSSSCPRIISRLSGLNSSTCVFVDLFIS